MKHETVAEKVKKKLESLGFNWEISAHRCLVVGISYVFPFIKVSEKIMFRPELYFPLNITDTNMLESWLESDFEEKLMDYIMEKGGICCWTPKGTV